MRRQAAVGKAGAVALALVAGVLATTVEAGVRLGHPRQDQCAAPGCNYVDGKGACVFAADGQDGLLMVLNGAPVRLHRRERLTVLRRGQAPTATPGNRFMSVYDSTGSSGGGVRVKILDTVVQPAGACPADQPECRITHFTSRIRIETPRDVVNLRGSGHCPAF